MKKITKAMTAALICITLTACGGTEKIFGNEVVSQIEDTESTETSEAAEEKAEATVEKTEAVVERAGTTVEKTEADAERAEAAVEETEAAAKKIILSGKPDDSFFAEEDCYAENNEIVMYFQKGITIKGDILEVTIKAMDNLCETSGLNFKKNYCSNEDYSYMMDLYFESGIFKHINQDEKKINIFVVNLDDGIEYADGNNAVLAPNDFDYKDNNYGVLYHELCHVLQFRNGVNLGSMMNEGFAEYTGNQSRLSHNIPAWDASQYYFPAQGSFDESLILGEQETFSYIFEDSITNYQFGFRFVTFLFETYGENIYKDILSEAVSTGFQSYYSADDPEAGIKANSLALLEIIKSQTSENILSDFSEWYDKNWTTLGEKYLEQVNSMIP